MNHDRKYTIRDVINSIVYGTINPGTDIRTTPPKTPRPADKFEYFTRRYTTTLETINGYAARGNAECVYLGAGTYAFWATLANGYSVAVTNDAMNGVKSDSELFSLSVYRDSEFVGNITDGTLDEQLQRVADGDFESGI